MHGPVPAFFGLLFFSIPDLNSSAGIRSPFFGQSSATLHSRSHLASLTPCESYSVRIKTWSHAYGRVIHLFFLMVSSPVPYFPSRSIVFSLMTDSVNTFSRHISLFNCCCLRLPLVDGLTVSFLRPLYTSYSLFYRRRTFPLPRYTVL